MKNTMKKIIAVVAVVLAATLALPTTTEAAAKPKLTKTSVKIQKNKKVTVKIKNGKIKSVKSSNKKVASVSYKAYKKNRKNTGVSFTIKGEKKAGKATITVKTTKGKTLKCKVTNKVPKPAPAPTPAPEPTPTPDPTPTPEPATETETEEDSEEETEEPTPEEPTPAPTPNPPAEDYGPYVTKEEAKATTLEYFKGNVTDDELKTTYRGYYRGYHANVPVDYVGELPLERDIAFKHASEMKPVIQEILALCNGKTQREQCAVISEWEMANIVADDYSNSHFTAYSAFTKKPSVCQAYREATEILLSVLSISYDVYVTDYHTWVIAHTDSVSNLGLDFGRIYEGTHSWVLEHENFTDTTGFIITEENKGAYVLWFDDLTCIEN